MPDAPHTAARTSSSSRRQLRGGNWSRYRTHSSVPLESSRTRRSHQPPQRLRAVRKRWWRSRLGTDQCPDGTLSSSGTRSTRLHRACATNPATSRHFHQGPSDETTTASVARPCRNHHHACSSLEGCGLMSPYSLEESGHSWVGCFMPPHKIVMKIGIRKLQKLAKSPFIRNRQAVEVPVEESHKQRVEFTGTAAASPPQACVFVALAGICRKWLLRPRRRSRVGEVGSHGGSQPSGAARQSVS